MSGQTEGQKDGETLFNRTLPTTTGSLPATCLWSYLKIDVVNSCLWRLLVHVTI